MTRMSYQILDFHHVGIPSPEPLPESTFQPAFNLRAEGYFESPYAIEWMTFEEDNDLPLIIRTQPHVGFVVENLDEALKGRQVILEPRSPAEGVRVAFVLEGRDLIEFLEFDRPEQSIWPHPGKFRLPIYSQAPPNREDSPWVGGLPSESETGGGFDKIGACLPEAAD